VSNQPTTRPVPADRDQPVAPVRSALADLALAVGVASGDVQAYLTSAYRFVRTDIGLMEVAS
jgi:hypothetical protein